MANGDMNAVEKGHHHGATFPWERFQRHISAKRKGEVRARRRWREASKGEKRKTVDQGRRLDRM